MFNPVRREFTRLLPLALPIVLAQILQMSNGFVDTLMVGRLGGPSLAAVALSNAIFHPLYFVCFGVLAAVSPMVSQAHGAGKTAPISRTVRQALWLGVLFAIPAIIVLWNIGQLLGRLGYPQEVVDLAQGYLRAVSFSFLPGLWFTAMRNFIEGLGRPRPVTVITGLGACLNAILNYVLMFGKLGLPAMGVVGTGLATTLVVWFLFAAIVLFVQARGDLRRIGVFSRLARPDRPYFLRLFRLGWPIGVMLGVEVVLFASSAFMMGRLGTAELAAHQIVLQCAALTFMVPLGIALATAVRVGHETGSDNPHGARVAGLTGVVSSAVVMSCFAAIFYLFPRPILSLFLDLSDPSNGEVIRFGTLLLTIAALFQVFDGVQVTGASALRGLADTRVPMVIALFAYWGVGLTSAYVMAFQLDLGASGVWLGLVLALMVAAVLLVARFVRMTTLPTG